MDIKGILDFNFLGAPLWAIGIGAVALYAVMTALQKYERKKDQRGTALFRKVVCTSCGWKGSVSRHKPRCGRCNSTSLNDQ